MSHCTNSLISRLVVLFQFTSPLGCRNVDQLAVTMCQSGRDARPFDRAVVQHCARDAGLLELARLQSIAQAWLFRDGGSLVLLPRDGELSWSRSL